MMEAFSELLRIRTAPVDPKELRLAKDGLERAMARRFATLSDVTSELASQVLYGLPDDFFSTFAKKVEAVTADDVMRVAKEHLDPAKLSMVIVGDRQSVEEQLRASPLGAFDEVDGDGHLITAKITPLPAGGAPQKTAAPAAPQHE
jgi:predicted Zn-dependent peptidase